MHGAVIVRQRSRVRVLVLLVQIKMFNFLVNYYFLNLAFSFQDRDRIVSMISELGGVVAENTKMEMLATHFISVLPNDTFTGMMVCALATGKWLLHVNFVYDSFRGKRFLKVSFCLLQPQDRMLGQYHVSAYSRALYSVTLRAIFQQFTEETRR